MGGFEYDKPLSIELVILQQIVTIGNLSTRIYFSPRSEWQTNALNLVFSIDMLESMSYPYLTDVYDRAIEKLDKTFEIKIQAHNEEKKKKSEIYLKRGQNFEMHLTLAYVKLKFRYLQLELERAGILRKRTTSAMDAPEVAIDDRPLDGTQPDPVPDGLLTSRH